MAISREIIRCLSCDNAVTLRLVVPIGERADPFLCPCPSCNCPLAGTFTLTFDPPKVHINSHDFKFEHIAATLDDPYPIVTVSTDLPVHRTYHVRSMSEGGSPYLWLMSLMPKEFLAYHERAATLELFRSRAWPSIRKAVTFAEVADWTNACNSLGNFVSELIQTGAGPTYACFRAFELAFVPMLDMSTLVAVKGEWFGHLNNCSSVQRTAYIDLLRAFGNAHGFNVFRTKVFAVYRRLVDSFDTVMLGMLFESSPAAFKDHVSDYRLFRADYDTVKSLYVDIFELISQVTLFLNAVVNLSVRSNAEHFASIQDNGRTLTAATFAQFRRYKAYQRLQTLHELPNLHAFVDDVSRPMRNDIGHFSAHYDYRSGDIVYDDGARTSYIEFSGSFLSAARAVSLLLAVVEKLEIDRSAHGV